MNKYKNKGFTLVEVVVTIAIIAIASAITGGAYMKVMEDKRTQADNYKIHQIEMTAKQIITRDDLLDEVMISVAGADGDYTNDINTEGKLPTATFKIPISKNKRGYSTLEIAKISSPEGLKKYLTNEVGEKVPLDSKAMKKLDKDVPVDLNITIVFDRQNSQQDWKLVKDNIEVSIVPHYK